MKGTVTYDDQPTYLRRHHRVAARILIPGDVTPRGKVRSVDTLGATTRVTVSDYLGRAVFDDYRDTQLVRVLGLMRPEERHLPTD